MRKFLLLLTLLACTFLGASAQNNARLTAPRDVCKKNFVTMHAYHSNNASINRVEWYITPVGMPTFTITTSSTVGVNGLRAILTSGRSITIDMLQDVAYYTITARIFRDATTTNYTNTDPVRINLYDCEITECKGSFQSSSNFKETFGTFTAGEGRRCIVNPPAPAPQIINYNCNTTSPLTDNDYNIYWNTNDGGRTEWASSTDHTGDTRGGMLICNSSYDARRFYRKEITGLCPGAVYNFTAWFQNLDGKGVLESTCRNDYIYTGVTFNVYTTTNLTTPIATFNTYAVSANLENDASKKWVKFGGSIRLAPGQESLVLTIDNNFPGGCGNDIAIDDISFEYCAPKIFSYIDGLKSDRDAICQGAPIRLTSEIDPINYFQDPLYQWQRQNVATSVWSPVSGPGYTGENTPTLNIAAGVLTTVGIERYRLMIYERGNENAANCYTPGNQVELTILEKPVISFTAPFICLGQKTTLQVNPGTYDIYNFTGPNLIALGGPNYNRIDAQPTTTSDYIVEAVANYGNGKTCSSYDTATLRVDTMPRLNLGPDTAICVGNTITLDMGSSNAAFDMRWTGGSIGTVLGQYLTLTPTVAGNTTYTAAVKNNACNITDNIVVTAMNPPTAKISTASQSLCGATELAIAANNPPTNQRGTWSFVGDPHGATFLNANSYSTRVQNLPVGETITVRWTVGYTAISGCVSYDQITIRNVAPPKAANAGPSQTVCGINTITLAGNAPSPNEYGTWSSSTAGVTFSNVNDPNATMTYSGSLPRTGISVTWRLRDTANVCTATTASVTHNLLAAPSLTVIAARDTCSTTGLFRLQVSVSGAPDRYSITATGANPMPGFADIVDQVLANGTTQLLVPFPNTVDSGTYTFQMSVRHSAGSNTSPSVCTSTQNFTVRILKPSQLDSISPSMTTICNGSSATLIAYGYKSPGAVWRWYRSSCGGTLVATGDTITVAPTATTTYYVRAEAGTACPATTCLTVTVNVDPMPLKPYAGADQALCNATVFTTAATYTSSATAGIWSQPAGGTAVFTNPNINITTVTGIAPGTSATLIWSVVRGACTSPADTVIFTNLAPIANNTIGPNQVICLGSPAAAIGMPAGSPTGGNGTYTYQWYSSPNGVTSFTLISSATGATYNPGSITTTTYYRRVVTSGCTSTSNVVQIKVARNAPVVASTPPAVTVNCVTGTDYTTNFGTPTFTHADNIPVTVTYSDATTTAGCNSVITRTWRATDSCGRYVETSQAVNIQDTTKPVFNGSRPADATVDCDAIPLQPDMTATDNCSVATVTKHERTQAIAGSACASNYQIIRTWIAADACGNRDSVVQTITVQDTTRPTFTTPAPADTTVQCSAIPAQLDLTASDNCTPAAGIVITKRERIEPATGSTCANNYTLVRTWIARDLCGNVDSVVQRLHVIDTTRPVFTTAAPANVIVNCDAIPTQPVLTATDNCSAPANITVVATQRREEVAGGCANTYRLVRVWTATDECGNIDSVRQIITVQDTTRPVFTTAAPADVTLNCDVPLPAQPTLTATDNCSAPANIIVVATQRREDIAGACANNYHIIRVWTATDECGNTDSVRQIITVQDTTRPVFTTTAPADVTMNCDVPLPAQPTLTATDNCSTPANVTVVATQRREDIAGACANNYRIIRVWTATDECGNTDSVRQIITVQDTTRPVFTTAAPANITVDCDAVLPTQPTLTATDNCSVPANVTVVATQRREDIAGACANNYRIIRTWIATDECGNTDSVRQIITVQDTTRPVFTTAAPANVTMNCDVPLPAQPTLTATDNCSAPANVTVVATQRREDIAGACVNNYRIIRVWTATDECGNTDSVRQIITVQDTTRPVFTTAAPANITVDCDAVLPTQPTLTATDNCSVPANVTVVATQRREDIAGACANNYRIIRTWIATDECGNMDSVRQIITVQDTTRPVFTTAAPADVTMNCDVPLPAQPTLAATDNCSAPANVTVVATQRREDIAGACANNYRIIRVWTATDECGNTDSVRQIITVQDTTRPVFTTTAPADVTMNCDVPLPAQPTLTATDNCSTPANVTVVATQRREDIAGACANNYRIIRVWTATDECGNTDSVRQIITVQDTTRPVFTTAAPANITVDCDAVLPTQPTLTATDNCSVPANVTVVATQRREDIAGACANNYRIIRTWIATDECGNTDSVRQIITVQDTTRPVFTTAAPANVTMNCDVPLPARPTLTATDNCSAPANVTVVATQRREDIPGACVNNYLIIRTWIATDECGNTDSVHQIITVQDTTRPTFTTAAPANITVNCDAVLPAQPTLTATDNCSAPANVTIVATQRREDIAGACVNNYLIIRTWIATDECGNMDSVSQVITVQDTTRPVFTTAAPADVTMNCDVPLPAQPTLTATDNCSAPANVTVVATQRREDIAGACANNYRIIRVWTATDECGNTDSVRQIITVQDTTRPVFTTAAPADITMNCDVPLPAQPTLTATDNCSAPANVTVVATQRREDIAGACANNYRIIRVWTATDECGNTDSVRQIITVQDTTRPVFTTAAPANITVDCDAVLPTQPTLTATDNCSVPANVTVVATQRREDIAGACANNYHIIRTWIATDECGNTDSVRQIITVQDTTRPVFTTAAPANITMNCDVPLPAQPTLTATDNCSAPANVTVVATQRREDIAGACVNNYLIIRTWIATDECGNTDSVRQIITVQDTTRPVFTTTAPADITVDCDAVLPTQPTLTATDNCSAPANVTVVATQRREDIAGACANNYLIIRTWIATDECGNMDSVSQVITVQDTTRPVFTTAAPADVTMDCDVPLPAQPTLTTTDNCSAPANITVVATQRREDIAGACANNYRIIRVWTATDECGNTDSVRQIITVQDTTRPVFTTATPADVTMNCDVPLPAQPTLTATDNCSAPANVTVVATQRREDIAGACANNYRIIRVWTATDECGNTDSVRQIITVQDTTRPVFTTAAPANVTMNCDVPLPTQPTLTATDNCSAPANVSVVATQRREDISGTCANNYRIIRTWIATDECGNMDSVYQIITVQDTTRPVFTTTAPADITVDCDAVLPTQPTLTATDNCSVPVNVTVVATQRREDIAGACVNNYLIIRTWIATDECGNTDSVRQIITVQDTTRPVFTTAAPANITVDCDAVLPTQPTLTATDNCSVPANVTVVATQRREDIAGACANNYLIIRTWIATDECGNTDSVHQVITVQDTTRPVFTTAAPADVTMNCDVPLPAQPTLTATDNCSAPANVTVVATQRREDIAGACANNYRIIRVWTATDECGNTDSVRQIITVQDTTRPVFTTAAPADVTINCDVPLPAQPTLTATDNCSTPANVTVVATQRREDIAGACANNYRIIRVWTVTDECGNTDSVRQIITVQDTTRPVFTTAAPANITVDCDAVLPTQPTLTATDNCSVPANVTVVATQRREDIAGACANNYRIIRTWIATDECGNTDSVRQIITVQDTTRPVFTTAAPADITVDCDAVLPTQPTLTATDNCSAPANVTVVATQRREDIAGACVNNYLIIRTWIATDECGNTDSVRQIITVQDTTRPVFTTTAPANVTMNCDVPLPTQPTLTATDNCSAPANVTVVATQRREDIAGACVNNYLIIRTWIATDECGNMDSVSQIITVQDTTRPVFTTAAPADVTMNCDVPLPAQPTLTATDNCSAPTNVTVVATQRREDIAGACANNYRIIRVWTATDECGNTDSVRQIITVQDTTRPVFTITAPTDITVDCDAVMPAQPTLTATDNCSAPANVTVVATQRREDIAGACANNYRIIRVWTATDECGNTDSVRQIITVQDTTRPVFTTAAPADVTMNCDVPLTAQPTLTATDNCSAPANVTVVATQRREDIAGACVNNYRIIRVWTATDECGNTDSVRQIITVQDTTRPMFTTAAPADITVNCDATLPVQPMLTATDNCSAPANLVVTTNERRENIAGACANNYRIIRTWTVTDECGNMDSVRQIITVQDTTRPTFNMPAPANMTVDCDKVPVQEDLTATDNCAGNVVVVKDQRITPIPGRCENNYLIVRTWTAIDECNNTTTITQTITVIDTTRPVFNVAIPANVTVDCNAVPAQPTLTATDNCSPDKVTVTMNEQRVNQPGACANNYQLIRTWTATDICGNVTVATQTITVQDTTRPVFTSVTPANVTVECDAVPAQPDLSATDICSPGGVTVTKAEQRIDQPGACANNYQLIRTWTATDECGNSTTVTQTITVQDMTKPRFTMAIPRDTTVNCDAIPVQPTLTATDNCSAPANLIVTMNQQRVDIAGACDNNYRLLRTWTATDECGNFTTALQIVTVQDTTKPVFTTPIPADVTVNCGAVPTQPDLAASDNCSPLNRVTVVKNEQREEISNAVCAGTYRLIRTWTALDQCGNMTVAKQIVTVQDTTRPVFTSPIMRDTTVNCNEVPTWPVVTATDNCNPNGVTITTSQTKQFLSATCSNNYRLIRRWTAKDECGNTAIMQQIITVQDTTRPTFSIAAPRDTMVNCEAVPALPVVTATDNCSVNSKVKLTQTQVRENIPNSCNYRLIRTWTATDECGNYSTMRQVITIQDTTRPVIAAAPANVTVTCQQPIPAAQVLRATDNCDASFPKNAIMTTDPFVADICNGYTITRRWNVTDACGNRAEERVQVITIMPCPKPQLKPSLPRNCSNDPFFNIETVSPVTNPTYILVGVTPSNAVRTPLSQTSNRFNLNGATSASFIVRDGVTGCASDTMTYQLNYIQTPVVNLGKDTSICGGNGIVLDAGANNYNNMILWSTGATTQRISVQQAGTYWVQVTNGSCVARDTIKVALIPMPLINLPDTTICRGQSVRLNATVTGATYLWSTGATTPSINVSTQERFWVRVMKNGCITIDTVNVTVNPPPDITLRSDTTICPGQSVVLSVSSNASRIQWVTGETGNSIVVSKAGNYWVAVTRDQCVVRDTVMVKMRQPVKFELGPDRIICPDGRFTIDARTDDAATYLWNDGDRSPIKSIDRAGTYILSIMDRYCYDVKSDSIKVRVAGAPKVSLGNDTMICRGLTYTIKPKLLEDATHIRWSNGQTGPSINVTEPGTYTVTAYNDCGSTTDEIVVDFMECESKPDIPNAFSPNGDGRNDIFRPVVRGPMYDYELRIFNRWGQIVFMSKDLHKGWDGTFKGKPVDNSTFVWWMSYKKVQNGPVFILKGEVTVIR